MRVVGSTPLVVQVILHVVRKGDHLPEIGQQLLVLVVFLLGQRKEPTAFGLDIVTDCITGNNSVDALVGIRHGDAEYMVDGTRRDDPLVHPLAHDGALDEDRLVFILPVKGEIAE